MCQSARGRTNTSEGLIELDRLELWVTEGNGAAIRLYLRSGFADTGRRNALPSNPALQIIQMSLNL